MSIFFLCHSHDISRTFLDDKDEDVDKEPDEEEDDDDEGGDDGDNDDDAAAGSDGDDKEKISSCCFIIYFCDYSSFWDHFQQWRLIATKIVGRKCCSPRK